MPFDPRIEEMYEQIRATVGDSGEVRCDIRESGAAIIATFKFVQGEPVTTEDIFNEIRSIAAAKGQGPVKSTIEVQPQKTTLVRIACTLKL